MVNPGIFHGGRLAFLTAEKQKYANAVDDNCVNDAVADIQRRFFKRFPVDLPLTVEPSPEHLASINDDEPDPEIPVPDKEKLSPEEYETEMAKLEDRQALTKKRRAVAWFPLCYPNNTDFLFSK